MKRFNNLKKSLYPASFQNKPQTTTQTQKSAYEQKKENTSKGIPSHLLHLLGRPHWQIRLELIEVKLMKLVERGAGIRINC